MTGEGGSVGTGDEWGSSSPKNKMKFLCSHGGKVLPRPSDGHLKYVGGETRVISVPRDITFSELMKKLSSLADGDMVLKYQLVPEDLDALVSVRTDEDLKHMLHEHDRHESGGAPMLRAFLFPSKPLVLETVFEHNVLEQRYVDAINGIIRTSPRPKLSPIRAFGNSSACSSPKSSSPDGNTADLVFESPSFNGSSSQSHHARVRMQRVRSSPSISSLSNLQTHSNGFGGTNVQQHDHSQYHNQSHHQHHHQGYPSPRHSQDPPMGIGMGRPPPSMPMGKADIGGRGNALNYYYSTNRHHKGHAYPDDPASYGHVWIERADSIPRSPRKSIWE